MLYAELLTLTDGKATYEQFEDIEAVYMTKEEMTKQQATRLWKRRYGEKVEKPRPAEMKAIKDAIRSFKHEREWGKTLESRIIEAYNEKVKNYIEENGVEFDENGYAKEYYDRQTLARMESELPKSIYHMWEEMGCDTSIYIIYQDGTYLIASGTEIVGGDITPKMQNIAYAYYQDGYVEFDTMIGDYNEHFQYFFDGTADEDEAYWEKVEAHKTDVEIRFQTEWGKKHAE